MKLSRRGRAIGLLSASALALGSLAAMAAPASAAPVMKTIACKQNIKGDIIAKNNIGPCVGGDAIKITTSNTVFDLGGHTIMCNNANNHTRVEQVGIHLINVTNVTVKNGKVSNCDAGVGIDGGGNNTVQGITAFDNVAHVLVSGPVNPNNPLTTPCNFGDGITTNNSNGNTISGNVVYGNGPFSGISLVGASSNNTVTGNQANNNAVSNALPPPAPPETNGPCGPFSATPQGVGRLRQDIGIRVEGPGATNNIVSGNQVMNNQLNGISIHGYVCLVGVPPDQQGGFPPKGQPNNFNQIVGNSVSGNGFPDGLDGIGVLSQGPLGNITCGSAHNTITGNSSTGNAGSGIYLTQTGDNSLTSSNTVANNLVDNNVRDGITVGGPFVAAGQNKNGSNFNMLHNNNGHNNARRDGVDLNPACDNNHWMGNIFGTVNQACVKANGGTGTVIPLA